MTRHGTSAMERFAGGRLLRRYGFWVAAIGFVLILAAWPAAAQEGDDDGGEAGNGDENIDTSLLPNEERPDREKELNSRPLNKPPRYEFLARSLRYYERRLGVEFYKNEQNVFSPYSVAAWDSFSIADASGQCLYDVEILGVRQFRYLDGARQVLLDMSVTPGPCNVRYPNADTAAVDRVSAMEGAVVSPKLFDRLDGGGMCSDKRFVQENLQVPYDVEVEGDDVEGSLDRLAEKIDNPIKIRFGDLVFFSPYPEERAVGIYVGYGLVVYNSCFRGKAHMMRADGDYRIYRLFQGPAWTRYRIHQQKFMEQYVGTPYK